MAYTNRRFIDADLPRGIAVWRGERSDGSVAYFVRVSRKGRVHSHPAGDKEHKALTLADELAAKVKAGAYTPPPSQVERRVDERLGAVKALQTVNDVLDAFREAHEKVWAAPLFFDDVVKPIRTDLGGMSVVRLTKDHVRAARDGWAKVSRYMANRRLDKIKAALRWAVGEGLIEHNPAADVLRLRQPKVTPSADDEEPRYRVLSPEMQRAMVRHAREFAPAIVFALATGCRWGEIAGLEWSDVDTRRGTARIRGTKTAASQRSIPLDATALDAIKAAGRRPAGPVFRVHGERLIGHGQKGRRNQRYHRRWKATARRAAQDLHGQADKARQEGDRERAQGLREAAESLLRTVPYDCRHTYLSTYLSRGGDAWNVAKLAGTSIVMIQRHYGHLIQRPDLTAPMVGAVVGLES